MTDYSGLVKALRGTDFGDACDYCEHSDMCKDDDCIILQAAAAIEALQAQLPKRGEWIYHPKDAIEMMFTLPKCSICGHESSDALNYCPNCGSRMRGEVNERG